MNLAVLFGIDLAATVVGDLILMAIVFSYISKTMRNARLMAEEIMRNFNAPSSEWPFMNNGNDGHKEQA